MSDLLSWIGVAAAVVVVLAAGQVLGDLVSGWLVRRENEAIRRLEAEDEKFDRRFFSDPEFAIAWVQEHWPEDRDLVERIREYAAAGLWQRGGKP